MIVAENLHGRPWIASRSQQGIHGRTLVAGPLQVNWYSGLRIYLTWPRPLMLAVVRCTRV